jgi:hypothetical protein
MFAQGRLSAGGCVHTPGPCGRWLALVLIFSFWSGVAVAQTPGELRVRDAHAWREAESYLLDAQFTIRLSSGAQEALENGVPLVLEFQIQVVKVNKWFWDTVEVELSLRRQLQYHALSRSYLVKELEGGTQGNYRRLEDALDAAGSIENLPLTDGELQAGSRYLVRMRGSLDIESLPTPVRLLAYVSSDWDMEGDWYAWPLVR